MIYNQQSIIPENFRKINYAGKRMLWEGSDRTANCREVPGKQGCPTRSICTKLQIVSGPGVNLARSWEKTVTLTSPRHQQPRAEEAVGLPLLEGFSLCFWSAPKPTI